MSAMTAPPGPRSQKRRATGKFNFEDYYTSEELASLLGCSVSRALSRYRHLRVPFEFLERNAMAVKSYFLKATMDPIIEAEKAERVRFNPDDYYTNGDVAALLDRSAEYVSERYRHLRIPFRFLRQNGLTVREYYPKSKMDSAIRAEREYTVGDLAEMIGVGRSTIGEWIKNKRIPSMDRETIDFLFQMGRLRPHRKDCREKEPLHRNLVSVKTDYLGLELTQECYKRYLQIRERLAHNPRREPKNRLLNRLPGDHYTRDEVVEILGCGNNDLRRLFSKSQVTVQNGIAFYDCEAVDVLFLKLFSPAGRR